MPVATKSPPNPPTESPKFHPKKSPEMTAPTPNAQSDHIPACRFNLRLLKYSAPSGLYSTEPTFIPPSFEPTLSVSSICF